MSASLLIVENEATLVVMAQRFFEGRGFSVTVAKTLDEFRAVASRGFTAALVDCSLVGALNRDGLRIVQELKAASPLTFVILFTASQEPTLFDEAKRMGADEVLLKPYPLTKIEQLILSRSA